MLRAFLAASNDDQSIYNRLKKESDLTEDEIMNDVTGLLIGGIDSTAHTMTSLIYLLKRHPEQLQKLASLLDEKIPTNDGSSKSFTEQFLKAENIEILKELEFLLNVVKEAQRYDGAAQQSLTYEVVQECSIRGVPLSLIHI